MSTVNTPGTEETNPYDFEGAVENSGLNMNDDETSAAGEPDVPSSFVDGEQPPNIDPAESFSGPGEQPPTDPDEETSDEGEPLTEAEKAARHFQGLYDKTASELDQLKQYEPVVQYIQQNPEVLNAVQAHVNGENPQVSPDGRSQETAIPERPERPSKPAGFDRQEATLDPDSDSAKYLQELAAFQDEFADWQIERDQLIQERHEQTVQEKQETAQRETARMQVAREAVQHGIPPEELAEFFNVMESPASRSTQNLVQLYQLIKGRGKQQNQDPKVVEEARKNEELRRKQESLRQPAASAPSNSSKSEKSDGQIFGQSLAAHARSPDIF